MKFSPYAAAALIVLGFVTLAAAVPPLDRPTPPPCCADGHCIANSVTYGWYETRWRRWPCECAAPAAGSQIAPTGQPSSELPAFDVPSAEEEDRRAPVPTAPRGEDTSFRGPANGGTGPGGQSSPGGQVPPPGATLGPLMQPGTESPGPRRGSLPAYEPQGAGSKSINTTPNGPSSELDPPPALPFGPQPLMQPTPIREANQRPAAPGRQALPAPAVAPSDDPPPGLPASLAACMR